MKKNKKNKAVKKTTLFGGATKSLRKLSKGTVKSISGLTTTQKVAGGAALVALGLSLLGKRRNNTEAFAATGKDATGAEENLAAMDAMEGNGI